MTGPKLLAIAASFRPESLNKKLLALAVDMARMSGAEVTVLDYAQCDAPIYRGETKVKQLPSGAGRLADALLAHDGLILATPEYNWSIPGGLKNLIDWLSVDARAPLEHKTGILMCASPSMRGGVSGMQQLRTPLEVLGMWVYPQLIGIGKAQDQLQEKGLAKESDQQHLVFCIDDFIRATLALVTHART